MAVNNTTMIIGIVVVVVILGVIVYWLGSGCKRDKYTPATQPSQSPIQSSTQSSTSTAASQAPQQAPIDAKSTPIPQAAPSAAPTKAPSAARGPTSVTSSNPNDFNNIKDEIGEVANIVMPMQTVDTAAGDKTLTQGNTHYILKGKKQRIVLPYENGSAVITEPFLLTQQAGGPSIIVGANNLPPKPTTINMGQNFFVDIVDPGSGKKMYILQQA